MGSRKKTKLKYASKAISEVGAAVSGQHRFNTYEDAKYVIDSIRKHYVESKDKASDDPDTCTVWILNYEVTDDERSCGYKGNFCLILIQRIDKYTFTTVGEKIERPLSVHPQKRSFGDHPTWKHAILQKVEKGHIFTNIEDARSALEKLKRNYPKVVQPRERDRLDLIIYLSDGKQTGVYTKKIQLRIHPHIEGGYQIRWENQKRLSSEREILWKVERVSYLELLRSFFSYGDDEAVLAEYGDAIVNCIIEGLWTRLGRKVFLMPEKLYHFCSNDVLDKIIGSGEVWLSDISFMNDAQELEYGRKLVRMYAESQQLDDSVCSNPGVRDFYERIAEAFLQNRPSLKRVLAFCLSEKGNSIGQWRAYGANGDGMSFALSSRGLSDRVSADEGFLFIRVQYFETRQEEILDAVFSKLGVWIDRNEDVFGPKRGDIVEYICEKLMIVAATFKTAAFAEEFEWRLLKIVSMGGDGQSSLLRRPVQFDPNGPKVNIPYVTYDLVGLRDGNTPLEEVVVGPTLANPEMIQEDKRLLLLQNSLQADVTISDVPYRKVRSGPRQT